MKLDDDGKKKFQSLQLEAYRELKNSFLAHETYKIISRNKTLKTLKTISAKHRYPNKEKGSTIFQDLDDFRDDTVLSETGRDL